MNITELLLQMKPELAGKNLQLTPFRSEEDDSEYSVWKVTFDDQTLVLKEAKEYEEQVYREFLADPLGAAPKLCATARDGEKTFLMMEYIPGETLSKCTRPALIRALDALITLQERYWEKHEYDTCGYPTEKALESRIRRGSYLTDETIRKAYEGYLQLFSSLPKTFCHDDLLPFNVLVSPERAVIIDWEFAGMLPYPTALARLIAHGEEDEEAFFHMTAVDKAFAVDYYYDHLVRTKGISYGEYRKALDYCLLYEHCEWVMVGIKYGDTNSERYRKYSQSAKALAAKLNETYAL